ncbi:rhomboid protease ROM8, putative [Plasmodium gallinaceum]|uniref:Rhomboid-like protease n=1 Tax=Plasmodium gallinaceum TaxID=5849 RepID=A0A1J1GT58_PLAGA|nr:rhomboid protease ROM8, putative [Plasmodium gallinaceum]CRG95631.1 rhomboid protease ROM8, putative [Plasmodium gallinaceum]
MVEKKPEENVKLFLKLSDGREKIEDDGDDEDDKKNENTNYIEEVKKRCLSFTLDNRKKINSFKNLLEEEKTKLSYDNNENINVKSIIKNDNINKRENMDLFEKENKEKFKKYELLNSEIINNTVKFYRLEEKNDVNNENNNNIKKEVNAIKEGFKKKKINKDKKFKMENSCEDPMTDHNETISLKVNYKIHKKNNYEKSKRKSFLSITLNEKQSHAINKSSICTDNVKFLNFLNDYEQNTYYFKNNKSYNKRKGKKKKTNIKKKERYDTKETLNNYILNIDEKIKYNEKYNSENIPKINTSVNNYPRSDKTDTYINESDHEKEKKYMNENRLNNYSTTIKETKGISYKNKLRLALQGKGRYYFFPKKSILRKRKEKIIIFLNHNYSIWENGRFNDHFYKTVHKNYDLDNLEEEKLLIDYHEDSKIKKIIYRIFPQFSIFSLLLYVTFIQWVIFISLISLKSDLPLTLSNDSLKIFGSNYPHDVFKNAEVYRLFTSLFLHSNFNHICANTYVQLTVGFLLEYLYGTFVVFLIYVFTGIYGIILSSPLTYCYSTTESSSSSSGIIGMFFSEILMMTNFNVDKISISVHLFCFFLLLLFLKFSLNTVSINIYSHFFGFLGGFLIGIILKRNQLKYFLKNNLLIQILCSVFLIISLATAIFLSTYVVHEC